MATSTVRPLAGPRQTGPRHSRVTTTSGRALIGRLLGGLLAALALGILVFQVMFWDRITPGVQAMGVDVGGLTREEALQRLSPNVESILNRPLNLHFADKTWGTTASQLGVRLDPAESVERAYQVGRQGNPVARLAAQVDALLHQHTIAIDSTTDRAALDASLGRVAREIDRAPQDARLTLGRDGTVQYTSAQTGLATDIAVSRDRVAAALAGGMQSVDLAVTEVAPAISDEQVRPAREQLDRLVGGDGPPLTLTFGRQTWPVARPDVVKLLAVEGGTRPGEPASIKVDEQPLRELAQRLAKELNQDVREARFAWNGGNLRPLVESREGRTVDQAATVSLIKSKLLAGERTAELPVEVVKPKVSSEDPRALGIVELIDRGSTSFRGSVPEKKHNIQLAAERLNGVVVPPGGTFSFNKEVGPTTLAAGFKWGFGITSGDAGVRTVPSVAGGICQVATTLFQPVFWSGYALEERYAHLYWIPAYESRGKVGLDVTVDEDAGLDFKWINPTNDYVLIQAATDEDTLYFGLYGKKPSWRVEVDNPVITNRVPPDPRPVAQEEPTLPWGRTVAVETAREGFDVVVTRRVYPSGGGEPRPLTLRTSYEPSRTVTLVGTANKPANANVQDALNRAIAPFVTPQATATPAARPTSAATATAPARAPAATSAPAPAATPVPKTSTQPAESGPTAQPTSGAPAAPLSQPTPDSQPTPAPKPQQQPKPSEKPTSAPAATPTKTP